MVKDRKLGVRHWTRVLLLLLAAGAITWYAKKPVERKALRIHGTAVWIIPSPQGLSSLIILSDDGNDSNSTRTGARLWLNPPTHPQQFESRNPALYRGPTLAAVGDSLSQESIQELASMVDTGGVLFLLGSGNDSRSSPAPLQLRSAQLQDSAWDWLQGRAGTDVTLLIRKTSAQLAWSGYRIQWWKTRMEAMQDSLPSPLSLGIIAQCLGPGEIPPHARNARVLMLVYCGDPIHPQDSSRVSLDAPNSGFALIEDPKAKRLLARRIHTR